MQPARFLIIEPDEAQQIAMRAALSASGYRCTGAGSAEAASELLVERYDIVFIGPSFAEADARAMADAVMAALAAPATIVGLTALPDLMIGRDLSGTGAKRSPELPAALEALTRFLRFAPARQPGGPSAMDRLVDDWAEYDEKLRP